ncbi:HBL/NHE enterotoxin family protein [Corallococcus sp. bb12-1]|uniref:HBL/NHE enterotoxin family protein n=1 Tax=Corallococcus sp. bb12-1 TaxID=2996784 RepID=UPI0022700F70|nr:HBL/NHE enterotoxin family protein [Corallococcus sp. bb12-1]MCY1043282.1 HBL/NHE enterotoxin family protein [Corallococcus sp. bb12-1]
MSTQAAATSAPSTSSAPSIAPPDALTQGVLDTNAAVPQVDAAVAALLALSVPSSTQVPSLSADVEKARADATLWTTTYRPQVLSTLAGVARFGQTFDTAYAQLQPLSVRLATGDSTAIAPFQQVLTQLQADTQATATATASVHTQLVTYETLIDGDIALLNADQSVLIQLQAQDTQAAQAASQAADQVEQQIQQDEEQIALAYLQGHYYVAALEQTIDMLTGKDRELRDQESQLNAEANAASEDAREAGGTSAQVSQYQTFLTALAGSIGTLDNGWNVLDSNFTVLLQSEDITTYGFFTPSLLAAVKADWDNLALQASLLLGI